jgi:hypothetical protein
MIDAATATCQEKQRLDPGFRRDDEWERLMDIASFHPSYSLEDF